MKPARNLKFSLFFFLFIAGYCLNVYAASVGIMPGLNLAGQARAEAPAVIYEAPISSNNTFAAILSSEFCFNTGQNIMVVYHNFTINIFTREPGEFYIMFGEVESWRGNVTFFTALNYSLPLVDRLEQIGVFKADYEQNPVCLYKSPQNIIIRHERITEDILEPDKNIIEININELKDIKANIFYGEVVAVVLSIFIGLVAIFWHKKLYPVVQLSGTKGPNTLQEKARKKLNEQNQRMKENNEASAINELKKSIDVKGDK